MEDNSIVKNIDYQNKAIPSILDNSSIGVDVDKDLYKNIIDAAEKNTLDIGTINSFSNISRSRDQVYSLLDMMSEDPIISSALEIYASDACEGNEEGDTVWVEADDPKVLGTARMFLNNMRIDEKAYGFIYRLVKYGDLYLRLYRKSEIEKEEKDKLLNEDLVIKAFSKNDKYAGYVEAELNPANIFDFQKFGKTYGYLKTHVEPTDIKAADTLSLMNNYQFKFNIDQNDIDLYDATQYVHAFLDDTSNRKDEEVTITQGEDAIESTYKVKRGKSVLYDSFKIWRELSLLENSVLLNRITKSSIVRTISVEVGDMEVNDVKNLLAKIKQMIEQKSSLSTGNSIREYTNPGPIENVVYVPTHDGKGAITPSQIGGDAGVSENSLGDLDYWKKKLYASLGIPGAYLGDVADMSTGFSGGQSLSLISSRYAKNIKRIQKSFTQAVETAINLMMIDYNLTDYIGKFSVRMQPPTTQEEKDRKDNLGVTINNADSILRMMDDHIEDPKAKLEIFKSVISTFITDQTIIQIIQDQIDKIDSGEEQVEEEPEEDIFGGSDELDLGGDELPTPGETASEPLDLEEPLESFYTNNDGELLNENNLPNFNDLGISYTDIK